MNWSEVNSVTEITPKKQVVAEKTEEDSAYEMAVKAAKNALEKQTNYGVLERGFTF